MSRYQIPYRPLQKPNEIRLLQLSAASNGRKTDFPEATLIQTAIESGQSISVLSYVWGTDKDEDLLNCDGGKVRITKNLGQALRRLQRDDDPSCGSTQCASTRTTFPSATSRSN
ncbi:hypothetical protein B0T14DRAFT_572543 [Immersiella caudata]|uniref:Heterokaryon incompatibility domain-containing protein n=1 Tax=Immersiella caudata TaxID=314043 RepID=A0AA39XDZ3_9PEZI|nr:hypothetical protein B0T14DRAFT_572543 [Immersiella caudata]